MHRALQAFEQVGSHELLHARFAAARGEVAVLVGVLGGAAGLQVARGRVHRKAQQLDGSGDLAVGGRVGGLRQPGALRDGLAPLRERADGVGVVVALDVLARAGNRHLVEDVEEVGAQKLREVLGGALLDGALGPLRVAGLRHAEHLVDVRFQSELLGEHLRLALVDQCQLVADVPEAVVDRRGRQHEHAGALALLQDLLDEPLVAVALAVLLRRGVLAVPEVVGLVYDHQVVVAPVEAGQVDARFGGAPLARQVGVVEHVVVQVVVAQRVVLVAVVVQRPVLRQALGAKHEHARLALALLEVVGHNGQRGERLAEAHGVGKDAAVVLVELLDDGHHRILLEVVEHAPDFRFLERRGLVGERFAAHVLQEFVEDAVERQVVD